MPDFEGNVLRPPGVGATKVVAPPEELLASYNPPPLKKGGTVKAGVGILRVGEPMKLAADGKTYTKSVLAAGAYDSVVGLNYTAVDATTEDRLINLIMGGVVNTKVLAITGTNAQALATAVGGRYFARWGYLKF